MAGVSGQEMTTIISFIIVLGVLIFIHELGHFLVAKYSGVGVEKFSLEFGPKLIGIKRGETEYRLSLLPLGGYVKMVGESPGESVSEGTGRSTSSRQRAAIVRSPIMNLVLLPCCSCHIHDRHTAPTYLEKPVIVGFVAPGGR